MPEPERGPHDPPPVPTLTQQELTGAWAGTSTPALNLNVTLTGAGGLPPDAFGLPDPFGRYAVGRLLGRGGMGVVFLAHDTQLDRPVALKIPTFRGALSATQKERFFREARAISALRHAHICPVFDVDEEQGVLFFTMAFIEGQALSAVIAERGPMAPEKAVELVRKVALAMHAAHVHGTIHRDLKPANIMIDPAGEPVVMDFGLARRADTGDDTTEGRPPPAGPDAGLTLTQHGSVLGTPAYMPPEQARGDVAAIGPRSDVYALGVILFELLTGRRPFVGTDAADTIRLIQEAPPPRLRDFYPWLAAGLEAACQTAMAKAPADRFSSMAAFADALKEVVEPDLQVVLPPPLPRKDSARPKEKRRRWLTPVGCLGVSVMFLVVCVGAPTLAVWWVFSFVADKMKEMQQTSATADTEWKMVGLYWKPPPADAPRDLLFPPTIPGGYRRLREDVPAPDPDLGLTLPGRRAVYATPDGDEIAVTAYPCPAARAKAIEDTASAYIRNVQQKGMQGANANRAKATHFFSNSTNGTITYGFSDTLSQHFDSGKLWSSQGWLFHFHTTDGVAVEAFPPKYLLEIGEKAAPPKK